MHPWRQLFESLDLVGDNFGLPHVSHVDEHVPLGSTVMVKSLRGVQPLGPNHYRPVDLNGALGTLVKVVSSRNDSEPRFQVVIGDGTQVALKAQKLELNIEKKGEMSAYAKMMLNTAGRGELAADIGGYSSLSESEEEGSTPSARSAAFRRQRGLENIGEARRLEEGKRQRTGKRMYDFSETQDPDGELLGSVVTLAGLINSTELNGCRGKVIAKKAEGEGEGNEVRFVVELEGETKEPKVVVKRRHLQFVDARAVWEHENAAHGRTKGRGKGALPQPSQNNASEVIPERAEASGTSAQQPTAKNEGRPKAKAKAQAKSTPEPVDWKKIFSTEDSTRLRDMVLQEVDGMSGSRISARQVEDRLRASSSTLLDVAKRYVDHAFKSRIK